jgi:hypothetical protein
MILFFAKAPQAQQLQFQNLEYQVGNVSKDKSPIEYEFLFTNTGNTAVSIKKIVADCACSTASYPEEAVKPGQQSSIRVVFNPYRAGPFEKYFSITTDAQPSVYTLKLSGYIMPPAQESASNLFVHQNGNLRFRFRNVNLGTISNKVTISKRIEMYNSGDERIVFTQKMNMPPYIKVFFDSSHIIEPRRVGTIVVSYDPKEKKSLGYFAESITMFTTDTIQPRIDFNLIVHITDPENEQGNIAIYQEPLAAGPRLKLSENEQYIGSLYPHMNAVTELVIYNEGSEPLRIFNIEAGKDCEILSETQFVLQPRQFEVIQVKFRQNGKTGRQTRHFHIITNDPQNRKTTVEISATVQQL